MLAVSHPSPCSLPVPVPVLSFSLSHTPTHPHPIESSIVAFFSLKQKETTNEPEKGWSCLALSPFYSSNSLSFLALLHTAPRSPTHRSVSRKRPVVVRG